MCGYRGARTDIGLFGGDLPPAVGDRRDFISRRHVAKFASGERFEFDVRALGQDWQARLPLLFDETRVASSGEVGGRVVGRRPKLFQVLGEAVGGVTRYDQFALPLLQLR